MAIITQFDTDPTLQNIAERHHAWHMYPGGMHGFPSRGIAPGQPGSGTEFFQFHKQLMGEFFAWNNVNHAASASDLAAWNAIPAALKVPATGWPNPWPGLDLADAEAKINANPGIFTTEDALGIHVEGTVHNWIHGAVANCPTYALSPTEKSIISGFHSVQSTWFYKIHGLVQYWRDRWISQHPVKSVFKEIHDNPKLTTKEIEKLVVKEHIKDVKEVVKEHVKEHVKDIKEIAKEHAKDLKEVAKEHVKEVVKEHGKDFKEKDKDLVENPGVLNPAIRVEFEGLKARLANLEKIAPKGQTFIKAVERPKVGQPVVKPKKTR